MLNLFSLTSFIVMICIYSAHSRFAMHALKKYFISFFCVLLSIEIDFSYLLLYVVPVSIVYEVKRHVMKIEVNPLQLASPAVHCI